ADAVPPRVVSHRPVRAWSRGHEPRGRAREAWRRRYHAAARTRAPGRVPSRAAHLRASPPARRSVGGPAGWLDGRAPGKGERPGDAVDSFWPRGGADPDGAGR